MRAPFERDWTALGLKSGVEIHQQLLTRSKLFCRCPAGRYTEHHDAEVVRHMRPTLSELGEYDGTALMEFKTKKEILYLLAFDSVCTYEMDDTPPFEIDREAVDVALEISLALNCNIVGELHVARKQYLDGSIPTGFQRTAIIGVEGWVPYKDRTIRIAQVSVEEDSCREVLDSGHQIVFRTDRLSMPLAEVVTYPDMRTPEEVAEVTDLLSRVMRGLGRVRRGAGATRQDVNVSVEGGTRVEIKGVPSIRLIPSLVAHEGLRQRALLDVAAAEGAAGRDAAGLRFRRFDATDRLGRSRSEVLRRAASRGGRIGGVTVRGMARAFATPVGPCRTLADEVAGRVRVVACLDEPPLMLHDGNVAAFGLTVTEWKALRHFGHARGNDAVAVVWGPAADVETALDEIEDRAREAFAGVPSETRQVLANGETDFERILPGPDRMYPDTDSPPLPITDGWIDRLRAALPPPPWALREELEGLGFGAEAAARLVRLGRDGLAARLAREGLAPGLLARALLQDLVALGRRDPAVASLAAGRLEELVRALGQGVVAREAFPVLASAAAARADESVLAIAESLGLAPRLRGPALADAVARRLGEAERPLSSLPEARSRFVMGQVMAGLRGRAQGCDVAALVDVHLG